MNVNKGTTITGFVILLACAPVAASTERPQLKNYASYTDFLRAVVDYAKNDGTPARTTAERECRDDEVDADGNPLDKENPCLAKLPRLNTAGSPATAANLSSRDTASKDSIADSDGLGSLDDFNGDNTGGDTSASTMTSGSRETPAGSRSSQDSGDALEHAIALARDGLNPVYVDPGNTRTTFRSFPMQPIDPNDLAAVSLIDALAGLLVTTRDSKIRLDIDTTKLTDLLTLTNERLVGDDRALLLNDIAFQQELLNNILPFAGGNFIWSTDGNYYSVVNATPSFIDDNGVGLAFSTQARVRAAIVDSDGWISSANPNPPTAGALVIDPLSVSTGTINAKLWAIDDASGNTSVKALLTSEDDLVIDLSNTTLGVAGATRAGATWNIGPASNFMAFGNDSRLTITLDSPIETVLANPDSATNTPLVRINGSIARLSLNNISLLDGSSKHGIHFGRYSISNLVMANTSIYFENEAIKINLGKGANNLHVALERIVLGGTLQDVANRTLPAAIGDAEMLITTPDNMQITLRAH